jgi:hypothetical protein
MAKGNHVPWETRVIEKKKEKKKIEFFNFSTSFILVDFFHWRDQVPTSSGTGAFNEK